MGTSVAIGRSLATLDSSLHGLRATKDTIIFIQWLTFYGSDYHLNYLRHLAADDIAYFLLYFFAIEVLSAAKEEELFAKGSSPVARGITAINE